MPSRWPPLVLASLQLLAAWSLPREYTVINEACPGAEWNIMCRECCEYGQVECVCPGRKEVVGYTIPCCRNEEDECDSCLIHPGCTIFENCKSCRNGSWGGTLDDFYVKGLYCAECRAGWYGGDCMRCGQVLRAPKGQILLESYPLNAHCEWTIHARAGFLVQLRVVMLSLEFDYTCQYDYIEVRDGDSSSSRVIKRFCGNERPAPLRSTGATLHVLFHSDGSKNFDGFHAIFEEVTACSSSPCLHDGTCLLDKTGSFTCACLAGYTGSRCESVIKLKEIMRKKHRFNVRKIIVTPKAARLAPLRGCGKHAPACLRLTRLGLCDRRAMSTWHGQAFSCHRSASFLSRLSPFFLNTEHIYWPDSGPGRTPAMGPSSHPTQTATVPLRLRRFPACLPRFVSLGFVLIFFSLSVY